MPDTDFSTDIQEIKTQINELGAHLNEERERGKRKDLDVENRIVSKLADKFCEKQDVELLRTEQQRQSEAIMQEVDKVRVAISRTGSESATPNIDAEHLKNLRSFIRSAGILTPEVRQWMEGPEYREIVKRIEHQGIEARTLNESTATEGGFLVPEHLENEIIRPAYNQSPVWELARIVQTTSSTYVTHDQTARPTASWVGEQAAGTASNSTYGEIRIAVHDLTVRTAASDSFLMDSPNPESEMAMDAGIAFAIAESAAFVTGSGVGRPFGFETRFNAAATHILTGNDAGNNLVAADDFYDLLYGNSATTGLHEQYRRNAVFCFNSNTLRKVLKLQDNGGNYLWNGEAGLQRGEPATIAGKPFKILEDMDDDGTNANNPVIVADWKAFYRIVERSGVRLLRDPYSGYPNVTFHWRKRIGGDVTLLEAGRLLVV